MAEDPYVYPGTNVLRNRFGLRDARELERRERDASYARLLQLAAEPLPGRYDLAHLQAFHRHIFGDVWPWAGELRSVAIAKENTMFALPEHIAPYLSNVLAGLPREDFLRGLPRRQLAARLAHYMAEINAVHPFREGNGRTQRAFVGQLAAQAGRPPPSLGAAHPSAQHRDGRRGNARQHDAAASSPRRAHVAHGEGRPGHASSQLPRARRLRHAGPGHVSAAAARCGAAGARARD
jgi:cell filamentation protein